MSQGPEPIILGHGFLHYSTNVAGPCRSQLKIRAFLSDIFVKTFREMNWRNIH